MPEYFIITNASSANLSHAELLEMQKTCKVKVYGPYSAQAMLKYFADGKIKGNTVVYEKGAPFAQTFSDIYPSLKAGGVDLGTPSAVDAPPQVNGHTEKHGQRAEPVPPRTRPVRQHSDSSNYITSSWRGEKSLAISYWINGFLLTFVLQILIGIYNSAASLFPHIARGNVKLYYAIALLFEIFAVAVAVWQTVGIWRSADSHKNLTGRKPFATLAQILVVITAVGSFVKIGSLGSYYNDVFWNALGKDPLGNYNLVVSEDSETLTVNGAISFGLASDVDKVLNDNQKINTVILNSDGGRIWEGENLYDILEKHKIVTTATETGCASACTIPFMAGKSRYLKNDDAILGFHSSSSLYYMQNSLASENARIKTFLIGHGISSNFANKALGTPPNEMWYPDIKTLTREGIVISIRSASQAYAKVTSATEQKSNVAQKSQFFTGIVSQSMNGAGYTYMLVSEGGDSIWIACPEVRVNVGDRVYFAEGMPMPGYESKSLNKKFDMVYFIPGISLTKEGLQRQQYDQQTAKKSVEDSSTINLAGIKKADLTIGEIYDNRRTLHGASIAVRGKVIKYSPGLLGYNWIQLQDGSGTTGSNDLIITTKDKARFGDTITARGRITVNKDYGYGYVYDVIMEDAIIKAE